MDLSPAWQQLASSLHQLPQSTLLMAALGAMVLGILGSLVIRPLPALGKGLRFVSTFGLMAILVLVVLQVSRLDPRFELAVPALGMPQQVVEGGETRVPLARDGHYWVRAEINGYPARFLVDTGATLTAVSAETAAAAGLAPKDTVLPVRMQTANGAVAAQITSINKLTFGNVAARGLDAIIAPNIGPNNVLGMNLLSRLASWRVEQGTLILVPRHPQAAGASAN
ncbi:MAG: TIGR02281 family clan AA aspartic protease [Croceibacterium sp.]